MIRWILFVVGLVLIGLTLMVVVRDARPPEDHRVVEDYVPWDRETLAIAESIPVQDGGRIKPLTTYSGFTMLRLYGARSMMLKPGKDEEAVKLTPLAWMLDALFRPHLSVRQPSFRVEDSAVVDAIGVKAREKRDRYSYAELEPGIDRLMELAQGYTDIEKGERTPLESQILTLAENVRSYEQLIGVFGMARNGLRMVDVDGLPDSAATRRANVSAAMATAPVIRRVLAESQSANQPIPPHVQDLLQQILQGANASKFGLFLFPPKAESDDHWLSPGERVMNAMAMQTRDLEGSIEDMAAVERLSRTLYDTPESAEALAAWMAERAGSGDEDKVFLGKAAELLETASPGELPYFRRLAFQHELASLKADLVERAEARGEYASIELEADYYRKNWFLYALAFFLIGTVLAIVMWMLRGNAQRYLSWGVWAASLAGLTYTVIPIVKRCIIMQRPPVGNLYDTIIFITAAVVIFGAVAELFSKRRLALGLLPIAGTILITLARLFEVGDGSDHMDPLVAVLRSNYWLTTHVITITLGYAGGLVAALLAMVYVLLRGLRLDGGDKSLRRSLTRSVYGMVCLTLILSLVGTVLGGIWANDSWGRFWGWDPKENGALMIVLTTLAILHARVGGFIREWGIHLASIGLAAVVTFSWWHVNLLGTGLHNYGFTEGGGYINLLYMLVLLFIGFGVVAMIIEKVQAPNPSTEVAKQPEQRATGA
ncbi:cytochrome c biogenesis protein [Haloferula sp. A504]|uniref:cytochrome c biogenesis protein n=1 Tax=Haloferula sp. A504 TaxID=3373601 RepID=UPI0031C37C3B|nr:cytochrome c biogenesis protein CcsA [Verrucomicrobiaceae bacterium E54]